MAKGAGNSDCKGTVVCCEDEKGEGFFMAVYEQFMCGCKVTGNGTLHKPITIKYCPKHSAAPELLDALENLVTVCPMPSGALSDKEAHYVSEAIQKAKTLLTRITGRE